MKLPNIDIDFYRTEEVIDIINNEFGLNSLNLSMLKYMRDVLRIIPKPIRMKHTVGKGGAPSYYTKESIELLRIIVEQNKRHEKTLKDIATEYKDSIHDIFIRTHDLYRRIRDFRGKERTSLNETLSLEDTRSEVLLSSYIEKLENAIEVLKKEGPEEEVYMLLEDFIKHFVHKYKNRLL